MLKVHAPDWVATDNIEVLVLLELDLGFETSALRKRWYDNSFTKTLRELVAQGLAEGSYYAVGPVFVTAPKGQDSRTFRGARLAHDLAVAQAIAQNVNRRVETMQRDLEAMDRALALFDTSIVPEDIRPVQGQRGYGKHGAFRA